MLRIDEHAAESQERFMNVCATLEADTKTTKVAEPGVRSFDNPAKFAQTATVFTAALRDRRFDTALAQLLTVGIGIVAAISDMQPSVPTGN